MIDANAYVKTAEIKAAVAGREDDILDAMGIAWRDGRPHIRCPYPDHDDADPSWRWDAHAGKAYCTCAQGDTIFDVMMKVERTDFEAAKLRAAEIIGLQEDLVREKSSNGKSFQKTDAASLLAPPIQDRDDTLPAAYLAYRLSVPVDTVLMPTTLVAGWKALAYFDPPPASKGRGRPPKPAHVGDFPCVVFETIDASGKRHAHRIYVAPCGAGKAELGNGPNGFPRDAKKSAKVADGDNISGRAVVWGDPGQVQTMLLCEGIETGAALAYAFGSDIEAGKVAVAAAISANGVEAFQPWAATKTVIVCADRDELAKSNGSPGSRRGEQAARAFAHKHFENIAVLVALPGEPGESVDWLDVLNRSGADAVRSGMTDAVEFEPNDAEIEAEQERFTQEAEIERIERLYPLPRVDGLALKYLKTKTGEIKAHKLVVKGDAVDWVSICTPFTIAARLRLDGRADEYGLRVIIQDMDDQPRAIDFDRELLPRMGASQIRAKLFAAGLRVHGDGDNVVVQALKGYRPEQLITALASPGWHSLPDTGDFFITPGNEVLAASDSPTVELTADVRLPPDVARGGTLEAWKDAAAAAIEAQGVPHFTLGILAGFAGPLISLTGLDTCGLNLSGLSSSGKSTAQKLAASAWSVPDARRPGLFQSARVTDNAIESLAYRATGTVLALDELAHVTGKSAGNIIYTLASGGGKSRMGSDLSVRRNYVWRTFVLLSGECSLGEKIKGDGGKWGAGMAVRVPDIDIAETNRKLDRGVLQRIDQIGQNYGHAGPAFVRGLIDIGAHRRASELREHLLSQAGNYTGSPFDSAIARAAMPFVILKQAGALAIQFELIPADTDIEAVIQWAWRHFRHSSDAIALDPKEQVVSNLQSWIAERWAITVKPNHAGDHGLNNRETLAWFDERAIYLPRHRLREAAGDVMTEAGIAEILDRQGLLAKRHDQHRRYVLNVPKIGQMQCYALKRSEFGRPNALEL